MSVTLRGSKFHYRFQFEGKNYSGVCNVGIVPENATPRQIEALRQKALAAEKAVKDQLVQDLCNLKEKEREIRQNKSVVALIENYRFELTGGRKVAIKGASELAAKKPSKRAAKEKFAEMRRVYWDDFASFMEATYPDIEDLAAVRRAHCEAYVSHLVRHGRFNNKVSYNITVGKVRKKVKEVGYTRNFLLSPKTIKTIVGVCRWVFSRLRDDAGIVGDPWCDVILPDKDPIDREVFTYDELQLIWDNLHREDFVYPLFLVAANSGMTEGDICTLEWSEIDWLANFIRRDRRKTGVDIELPIMPQLAEYLSSLPRTGRYVFPEHAETYLDERQRCKVSERVIKFLTGIGIKTRKEVPGRRAVSVKDLHSMRHVFAYRAKKAGIPTSVIKKMLGHAHETMTEKYADHDTIEDMHREIRKLSSPFAAKESSEGARRQLAELAYQLPEETVRRLVESISSATTQETCRHLLA